MQDNIAGFHEPLITVLYDYIFNIIGFSLTLASIFMIILVGTKVATYFANPGGNFDPYILVRPILILAALSFYEPLVETLLIEPVGYITQITEQGALAVTGAANRQEFEEQSQNTITNIQDTSVNPDGSTGDGVYDILQMNPGLEFMHMLLSFIARIAIAFMLLWQLVYKGIYLVLGIFVLPFSLIPGNGDVVKKWFFGFLSVLLWVPILEILQTIFIILARVTGSGSFFSSDTLLSIAVQFMMIMLIFRTPRYANYLVTAGADSGSGFTSNIISQPSLASYRYIRGK